MADIVKPTIGRIVHYRVTADEAKQVNRLRERAPKKELKPAVLMAAQRPRGNALREGDTVAAIVVAVWSPTTVNLQCFLDGNDQLWATSRQAGDKPGNWFWPPRE